MVWIVTMWQTMFFENWICQWSEMSSWCCRGILCMVTKSEMVVSAQLQYQSCPNKWPDDIDVRACHIMILSCQRRLFPEVQRLLPRFFKLTNLKCSYTLFNKIIYVIVRHPWEIPQIRNCLCPLRSNMTQLFFFFSLIFFFFIDYDSTLTWSWDQQFFFSSNK